MRKKRWTEAEDAIVRDTTIKGAIEKLPHRTLEAIKSRRSKFTKKYTYPHWSPAEDRKIRKYSHEPAVKFARRFKNRTLLAVMARRYTIGCQPTHRMRWKITDWRRLERLWPAADKALILASFPGRTWEGLISAAHIRGVLRKKRSAPPCANELRNQVKRRCQEDGVSIARMGMQIGCRNYFTNTSIKSVDYNKIAAAVGFFGGKLVIDWQDE